MADNLPIALSTGCEISTISFWVEILIYRYKSLFKLEPLGVPDATYNKTVRHGEVIKKERENAEKATHNNLTSG